MSKGSPVIPIRIPPTTLASIDEEIRRINLRRKDVPFCRSTWIMAAIMEKIAHSTRSRGRRQLEDNSEELGMMVAELAVMTTEAPPEQPAAG